MDELIDALNLIKSECEKHEECDGCPLLDYDTLDCGVYKYPKDYKIRREPMVINTVIGGD